MSVPEQKDARITRGQTFPDTTYYHNTETVEEAYVRRIEEQLAQRIEGHETWAWNCTVPVADKPNGDALDAYAHCRLCPEEPA